LTNEYLTVQQVADRLGLDVKTVQNKMSQGVLVRGVHWFRPRGMYPRFKWSAIIAWLEERESPAEGEPTAQAGDLISAIPMSRGYRLGSGR